MTTEKQVRTCLWFQGDAGEAASFYVSLLPDSSVDQVIQPDPAKPPLIVNFTLAGAPYMLLAGGPHYTLTPAASIYVEVPDQQETDRLWDALTADGGEPSRCGWLVDRFGVSWQIIPQSLPGYVGGPDREGAKRATEAMMGMSKIVIADLKTAYEGTAE